MTQSAVTPSWILTPTGSCCPARIFQSAVPALTYVSLISKPSTFLNIETKNRAELLISPRALSMKTKSRNWLNITPGHSICTREPPEHRRRVKNQTRLGRTACTKPWAMYWLSRGDKRLSTLFEGVCCYLAIVAKADSFSAGLRTPARPASGLSTLPHDRKENCLFVSIIASLKKMLLTFQKLTILFAWSLVKAHIYLETASFCTFFNWKALGQIQLSCGVWTETCNILKIFRCTVH